MFFALGIVDQTEGVVGVQQLAVDGQGVLQGGRGAVVFSEGVISDAKIGVGPGVIRSQSQGLGEFLPASGVVVLIHVDYALVVVPARARGEGHFLLRRALFARCAQQGDGER